MMLGEGMKIIIVRHGQSEANAKKISQGKKDGWVDTSLTKKGRNQAKKIAQRLRNEKIRIIYSSDLKRAKETAKEINKFHNVKIKLDKRLRDMLVGEDLEKFIKKIKSSFRDIKKEEGNALVVAHGSSCLTLLAITTGSRKEGGKIFNKYKDNYCNTCVSIVERNGKKYKIKLIGCRKHLEG